MAPPAYLVERSASCCLALAFRFADHLWNSLDVDVTSTSPSVFIGGGTESPLGPDGTVSVFLRARNRDLTIHLFATTRPTEDEENGGTANRTHLMWSVDDSPSSEIAKVSSVDEVSQSLNLSIPFNFLTQYVRRMDIGD